jgi:hypothetical protein
LSRCLDEEGAGSDQGAIYKYQGKPLLKEAVGQIPAVTSRIRRKNRKNRRVAIDIAMYRMGLETIAKAEGIEKRARRRREEA